MADLFLLNHSATQAHNQPIHPQPSRHMVNPGMVFHLQTMATPGLSCAESKTWNIELITGLRVILVLRWILASPPRELEFRQTVTRRHCRSSRSAMMCFVNTRSDRSERRMPNCERIGGL